MARKKSLREIYAQGDRLAKRIPDRSEESRKRYARIMDIVRRYDKNVVQHFGRKNYINNEQFDTPLSRSTYMGLSNG